MKKSSSNLCDILIFLKEILANIKVRKGKEGTENEKFT